MALAAAMHDPPDPDLLDARRAATGDAAAFERLYRAHVGRVHALHLRMTGDIRAAEELTQRAFVRAWERLGRFEGRSRFSTWLHRLAVRVAIDARRAEISRREQSDDEALANLATARAASPGARLDLERAIALLPEGARVVLVLHDVEGWRHADIAELLGVTEGTTKSQLHRARRLLREALSR